MVLERRDAVGFELEGVAQVDDRADAEGVAKGREAGRGDVMHHAGAVHAARANDEAVLGAETAEVAKIDGTLNDAVEALGFDGGRVGHGHSLRVGSEA